MAGAVHRLGLAIRKAEGGVRGSDFNNLPLLGPVLAILGGAFALGLLAGWAIWG